MMEKNFPQLPKGWTLTNLGSITEPSKDKVNPNIDERTLYIGLEHIQRDTGKLITHSFSNEVRSTKSRFFEGDLLYGKLRPYLNKVHVAGFDGICSTDILVFPKGPFISNKFLSYRLLRGDFVKFASLNVSGVQHPRVDFNTLSKFQIALPPLSEQQRIVAKIEQLFSDLDAGVEALKKAREKLKCYRKAVLKAAVEGDLTAEWRQQHPHTEPASELLKRILTERRQRWEVEQLRIFKEKGKDSPQNWKTKYKEPDAPDISNLPLLPQGWCWTSWGQIGVSQNGRPFPSKEYLDSGIKLLRPGNLYADGSVGWNNKNTRFMPEQYSINSSDLIIGGEELVINLTAQSLKDEFLGRVCLTKRGERCLLNQRLARLTSILVLSKYMLYLFKSSHFRKFVDELNTGSLIQHMFTSQLEKYVLPLPPLVEQEVIVEAVEKKFSIIDRLDAELQTMLQSAQALRQAILKNAFSGQLVPQDPEDEPAEVLLTRIREEKAKQLPVKKLKRKAIQRKLDYGQ